MKYQFIEQYKQEFPIVVMCRVLDVSESGFYAWRKRPVCQRQREDAQLTQEIRQEFRAHQGRYGSARPGLGRGGWKRTGKQRASRLLHFFGPLKDECVGEIIYSSHDEARLAIFT